MRVGQVKRDPVEHTYTHTAKKIDGRVRLAIFREIKQSKWKFFEVFIKKLLSLVI